MSIRFQDVSKAFGKKVILKGLSFEVKPKEVFFILGKSGVGKSLILKQIMGIISPSSGRITIDQWEATNTSHLLQIRKKCGMVFQHPALLDSLSVYENLIFSLRTQIHQMNENELLHVAKEALDRVKLSSKYLHSSCQALPYGVQKRISLARTLVQKPDYLLFDEPTTGLDPKSARAIYQLIEDLSKEIHGSSIVVSHDISSACQFATQLLFIHNGEIEACGSFRELKSSKSPLVHAFLQEVHKEQRRSFYV